MKSVLRACRGLTVRHVAWMCLFSVVIFNEYIVYYTKPLTWPTITPPSRHSDQLRVLFAADPQLLGYHGDHLLYRWLAIWDSDRYLYKGFWSAFSYVRPDVVIFLGDILDEGDHCSEQEYQTAHQRFSAIFKLPKQTLGLYLPGDNDIGGEGIQKTEWLSRRFEKFFQPGSSVHRVKFVDFIKLNLDISDAISEKDLASFHHDSQLLSAPIRVIVNHHGVLERFQADLQHITDVFRPHFFIVGHYHKPYLINITDSERTKFNILLPSTAISYRFRVLDMKYRIQLAVPSCSYRMGFPSQVGYGAVVIDSSGNLEYHLLRLPHRFHQLWSYIIIVAIIFIGYVVTWLRKKLSWF